MCALLPFLRKPALIFFFVSSPEFVGEGVVVSRVYVGEILRKSACFWFSQEKTCRGVKSSRFM